MPITQPASGPQPEMKGLVRLNPKNRLRWFPEARSRCWYQKEWKMYPAHPRTTPGYCAELAREADEMA